MRKQFEKLDEDAARAKEGVRTAPATPAKSDATPATSATPGTPATPARAAFLSFSLFGGKKGEPPPAVEEAEEAFLVPEFSSEMCAMLLRDIEVPSLLALLVQKCKY